MNNRSLFEDFLPTEPSQAEFLPSLDMRDLSRLARTCRNLHQFFKEPLLAAREAHFVIVKPDKKNKGKVIAMLDADPTLLNNVIKQTKDTVGRIIKNKTLFQLAYGAGDDDYCQAMKPAFIKLCGSEAAAITEMERQRNEMLESEEKNKKKEAESKAHLKQILQPVIAAISAEQFNLGKDAKNKLILSPATLAAIETFRKEFAKSQPMVIEKGMHFRYNALLEVYEEYAEVAVQWYFNANKCALFEDGVLSYVLSYVPENDAQKLSQGLYYLQEKNEPFRRSSALRVVGKNFHDVVRGPSSEFGLVGSCINIFSGGGERRRRSVYYAACQTLYRTKVSNLQSLCSQPSHTQNPSPGV